MIKQNIVTGATALTMTIIYQFGTETAKHYSLTTQWENIPTAGCLHRVGRYYTLCISRYLSRYLEISNEFVKQQVLEDILTIVLRLSINLQLI